MRECQKLVRFSLSATIFFILGLSMNQSFADSNADHSARRISRAPANYIMDDDMIVVPITIEKTFIDDIHEQYQDSFKAHKKTVEGWQLNQEKAEAYGLEDRGIFRTATLQQRQNFMQRNYLRFYSKKFEQGTNEGLQNLWEQWTADDEIESIKAIEKQDKILVKAKKKQGRTNLDKKTTAKVGKKEFKFGFQPRIELGMVKLTMDSPYFKMRAWLGVNGNQEVKLEKRIKATKTSAMVNYFIDQDRVLAVVDQGITGPFSLRMTHDIRLDPKAPDLAAPSSENNTVQLRFRMGF